VTIERVVWTDQAKDDFRWLHSQDKALARRVAHLVEAITLDPFAGIGKPEPLKFNLRGHWSRRVNREHRLVYRVEGTTLVIVAARYHYTP
jgi:toxin YoeB